MSSDGPCAIVFASAAEFLERRDELATVHAAAFGTGERGARRFAVEVLPVLTGYAGFQGVLALTSSGVAAGFACANDAHAHQPWFDRVSNALVAADHEPWRDWPWEYAELAVDPEWQRCGLGQRLCEAMHESFGDRRGLLVTWHGDSPARRLYLRAGWQLLVEDFRYAPDRELTSILGWTVEGCDVDDDSHAASESGRHIPPDLVRASLDRGMKRMDVTFVPIHAETVAEYRDGIGRVYEDVWKTDVDQTAAFLETALARHLHYADFAGLVALSADGQVVGFTYGYRTEPGGWWHELVKPALAANGNGDWLEDAFEFVELAVDSAWHGQGIGGALHDRLLRDRRERVALLSTQDGETPAQMMYAKRGWVSLAEGFQYLPGGEPCSLLGLDLAAFRERFAGR